MNKKEFFKKMIICVVGMIILSHGIAFAIRSNLGITPMHALSYSIYRLNRFTVGTNIMFFFTFLVVIQIPVRGKKFKFWHFYQVPLAVLFGYFVDVALWNLRFIEINTYFGQLFLLFMSVMLMPLGIVTYMEADLVKLPPEGAAFSFVERFNVPFHKVKLCMDSTIVVSAIIFSLVFIGGIYSVREGSVILALAIGRLIPYMKRFLKFVLKKLGV